LPVGDELFESYAIKTEPSKMAYSSDGNRLIVLAPNGDIHVLDPDSLKPTIPKIRPETICRTFAISPDHRFLASGGNGVAQVWKLADGQPIGKPMPHPETHMGILSLCFDRDGQRLLTACHDGQARFWDWETATLVCPPLQNATELFCVAMTPDDKYAVTGSLGEKGGVRVWELATGKPIAPADEQNQDSYVTSLVVLADGSRVLACSHGALRLIDLQHLVQPPKTPVKKLRLLGELATSQSIDRGNANGLNVHQWQERWEEFVDDSWHPSE